MDDIISSTCMTRLPRACHSTLDSKSLLIKCNRRKNYVETVARLSDNRSPDRQWKGIEISKGKSSLISSEGREAHKQCL